MNNQFARAATMKRRSVDVMQASLIPIKSIDWIWHGWLSAGKFHILAGAAGTGKTNLAMWMASIVSVGSHGGKSWPENIYAPKGGVLIWSGEDGIEDTIIPRLIASGADLNNVHIIRGAIEHGYRRPFDFKSDLDELSAEMMKIGPVSLVIIDSIVQAVAGDSNKNSEVRHALDPLIALAEQHNCAILGITHLTKNSSKKDPLDRVAGSMAFGAVARIVMITAKIKGNSSTENLSDSCVLVRAKSNISRDVGGYEYTVEPVEFQDFNKYISTSRINLNETLLTGSAQEILKFAETDNEGGKVSRVD
ncbi:MAG: AAA family ATPase, partial [Candidatus Nitrotoga sp.]